MNEYTIETSISKSNLKMKSQDTDTYILKGGSKEFYSIYKSIQLNITENSMIKYKDKEIKMNTLFKAVKSKSGERIVLRNTSKMTNIYKMLSSEDIKSNNIIQFDVKIEDNNVLSFSAKSNNKLCERIDELIHTIDSMGSVVNVETKVDLENKMQGELGYSYKISKRYSKVYNEFLIYIQNLNYQNLESFHQQLLSNKENIENIKRAESLYLEVLDNLKVEKSLIGNNIKTEVLDLRLNKLDLEKYMHFYDKISETKIYEYFNFTYNKGSLSAMNSVIKMYYEEYFNKKYTIALKPLELNTVISTVRDFEQNFIEIILNGTEYRICEISKLTTLEKSKLYKEFNFINKDNIVQFNRALATMDESDRIEIEEYLCKTENINYSLTLQKVSNLSAKEKTLRIKTPSENEEDVVEFNPSCLSLGNRIMALVGQNGIGKSRSLYNLYKSFYGIKSTLDMHYDYSDDLKISDKSTLVPDDIILYEAHNHKLINDTKIDLSEEIKKNICETMCRLIPSLTKNKELLTFDELVEKSYTFSTGQNNLFKFFKIILSNLRQNCLILIDEIEIGLHPQYIQEVIREINIILEKYKSYAIIATHSLHVVQAIPRNYIYNFNKGEIVRINTFGENLQLIEDEIFGLRIKEKYFFDILKKYAGKRDIQQLKSSSLLVNAFSEVEDV